LIQTKRANIQLLDRNGENCLFYAGNEFTLIQTLILIKISNFIIILVRRRSNLKKTNIVQFLLKKNVNAAIKNNDGDSLLDISITNSSSTILNLILDKLNDNEVCFEHRKNINLMFNKR
jgi:hypothetical protein